MKIGAALGVPFEFTLSCMNPSGTTHCGLCSKCRERQRCVSCSRHRRPHDLRERQPEVTEIPPQRRGGAGLLFVPRASAVESYGSAGPNFANRAAPIGAASPASCDISMRTRS